MMPGDMIVCGVHSDFIVEDIQVSVPQGHPVLIPAEKVLRSTDVHRALSQGFIFRLHNNNILRQQKVKESVPSDSTDTPVEGDLRTKLSQLQEQNASLLQTQRMLESQVTLLTAQLQAVKPSAPDARIDEILELLKTRQATISDSGRTRVKSSEVEEEVVPTFIPSQIKPSVDEVRISVEETSSKGNVAATANALRKLRANQ